MFEFAEPFDEDDILWDANHRETEQELVLRLGKGLQEIMEREWKKSTCALIWLF